MLVENPAPVEASQFFKAVEATAFRFVIYVDSDEEIPEAGRTRAFDGQVPMIGAYCDNEAASARRGRPRGNAIAATDIVSQMRTKSKVGRIMVALTTIHEHFARRKGII